MKPSCHWCLFGLIDNTKIVSLKVAVVRCYTFAYDYVRLHSSLHIAKPSFAYGSPKYSIIILTSRGENHLAVFLYPCLSMPSQSEVQRFIQFMSLFTATCVELASGKYSKASSALEYDLIMNCSIVVILVYYKCPC